MTRWDKTTAAALIAVAVLYIFLETVVLSHTHESVEASVLVLLAADLVTGGLIFRLRLWWMPLLGAALLLIGMVAAIPHDLPTVIHPPNDPVHLVFSLLILGLPLIGAGPAILGFHLHHRTAGAS